jgi:histidyl-tRNA synthetase
MQRIVAGAPLLLDSLDAESRAHFEALCAHLRSAGIEYHVEPHLVRGLDYYTRTVFEWTTDALGRRARCAPAAATTAWSRNWAAPHPGIGWAMGQERIVMLLEKQGGDPRATGRRFIWCWPGNARDSGLSNWRSGLRDAWPDLRCSQSRRREFQDAVQARRQERRAFALVGG